MELGKWSDVDEAGKIPEKHWSKTTAKRIETGLTRILSCIPSVTAVHGCSLKGEDYKVAFTNTEEDQRWPQYFLTHRRDGTLVALAGGQPFKLPVDVINAITGMFPRARYEQIPNFWSNDGFHLWHGVTRRSVRMARAVGLK